MEKTFGFNRNQNKNIVEITDYYHILSLEDTHTLYDNLQSIF